jgi:ribonuclease-3
MVEHALADITGYRFRNAELLRQALTHRSFGVPHNERLEFLGDGVLNCVVAATLFERFPQLPEGDLSRLRASLVNQQTLYEIAQHSGLGGEMLLGEGELKSGGAQRPSILADALEALIGAAFLDGGFAAAQAMVLHLFERQLREADPQTIGKDAKTLLQEFLQARRIALPQYTVVATAGEAHEQNFRVECAIPELKIRTHGEGSSRRSAEQVAARQAYDLSNKT